MVPSSVDMTLAANDRSEPTPLDEHLRARAAHVATLRELVHSEPALRLAARGFDLADGAGIAKLRRNAYVEASHMGLSSADALILMACAVHDAAPQPPTFTLDTAAALWDLPTIGPTSSLVEYAAAPGSRGRSPNVRRRRTGLAVTSVQIGGLQVTPYERSLVDHSRHARLESAISVCDNALHLSFATRAELFAELALVPKGSRGRRMAQLAIHLADALAESPLESLSRTRMFQLGLPRPQLQTKFYDHDGLIGRVDFYWPHLGLVGESDGGLKYAIPEGDSGQAAIDALLREKRREQRLRRAQGVDDVTRWDWDAALPPTRLHAVLSASGLRSTADGGWPVPDGPLPARAFPAERLR